MGLEVVTRAGIEVEDADDEQLVLEIRPGAVVEEGLERLYRVRVRVRLGLGSGLGLGLGCRSRRGA